MNEDTIDFRLPPENPEEDSRECHMSLELFQNASRTMGEIRDWMRETGVSWDFICHHIEKAQRMPSSIDKALDNMDEYTTGLGRSLRDKDSNVW